MRAEQGDGFTAKGWAREGILSFLLKKPATLSEIAKEVGISKSTASYHMKGLVNRGIAEIRDVRRVRGGVYWKTFALRQGKVVMSEAQETDRSSDRTIAEQYERLKMNWSLNKRSEEVIIFLYDMFLSLNGAQREEVRRRFSQYGRLFGREVLAPSIASKGVEAGLREILNLLSRLDIAVCTLDTSEKSVYILSCSNFFRTSDSGSPVFRFLQGVIEGALASKHGERFQVEEREEDAKPPELLITRRRVSRT